VSVPAVIEAAGGLLWRPGEQGTEVALVHRPKYDDWSLPKGKLESGEHPLLAALREVEEEAGARVVVGRPLGHSHYAVDGRPKRVQYWSLQWASGDFRPNHEVDRVDWVPIEKAADRLTADRDGFVVDEFLRDPRLTRACVVVRHARAGSRSAWKGRDDDRPLDQAGRGQARVIAGLLAAYGVSRAWSADVRRCIETLAPFAFDAELTVETEHLFSESGYPAHPDGAAARALEIVDAAGSVAICTQGGALPDLVVEMCRRLGTTAEGMRPVRKGSLVVVHVTVDEPTQVVAVEQLPAPTY
jgi:8-oxo-dGTP pyrophosphatase MutT (NUDIX family)/phosphohistidine phosphatase SixA